MTTVVEPSADGAAWNSLMKHSAPAHQRTTEKMVRRDHRSNTAVQR